MFYGSINPTYFRNSETKKNKKTPSNASLPSLKSFAQYTVCSGCFQAYRLSVLPEGQLDVWVDGWSRGVMSGTRLHCSLNFRREPKTELLRLSYPAEWQADIVCSLYCSTAHSNCQLFIADLRDIWHCKVLLQQKCDSGTLIILIDNNNNNNNNNDNDL